MIDIDSSYFVVLGLFLVLWMFLRPMLFTPYLESLAARDARTVKARGEASELDARANEAFARYQREFGEARSAASEARSALRGEGIKAKEATISASRETAAGRIREAQERIETETRAAHETVADEVNEVSRILAEKILGRSV